MKTLVAILFAAVILLAGCTKPQPQATLASAEEFAKLFVEQLSRFDTVKDFGAGRLDSGNIHARDFGYLLSPDKFPPGRLYDTASTAMKRWGRLDAFPTKGEGGGDQRFSMNYGSAGSQAFVDIVAYAWADRTRVAVYIRVVE